MVNGAVAGLVAITPACGFVNTTGAFFIGIIGGIVCYFGSQLKYLPQVDDALDAFGVHAIGGITGAILTGFFADKNINGYDGVFYTSSNEGGEQLGKQVYCVVIVSVWAAVVSFFILVGIDMTIGLRVSEEIEVNGLDKKFFREELNFSANSGLPAVLARGKSQAASFYHSANKEEHVEVAEPSKSTKTAEQC